MRVRSSLVFVCLASFVSALPVSAYQTTKSMQRALEHEASRESTPGARRRVTRLMRRLEASPARKALEAATYRFLPISTFATKSERGVTIEHELNLTGRGVLHLEWRRGGSGKRELVRMHETQQLAFGAGQLPVEFVDHFDAKLVLRDVKERMAWLALPSVAQRVADLNLGGVLTK